MKAWLLTLLLLPLTVVVAIAETPANTLVVAKNLDDVPTLDPAEIFEVSNGEIGANVYDRLFGREMEDVTKLVPTAAQSYTVSADGKVVTVKLRTNVTFTSGNNLRASDVVFSFRRIVELGLTPAYLFEGLGWSKENIGKMVSPIDETTLEIRRGDDVPLTVLLNTLSTVNGSIVDEKVVMAHEVNGDLGHEWLKSHSAGSGAYSIEAWNPGEALVLARHDEFRRGAPPMERVILRHVPESGAQLLLLQQGDVDIARNLTADQIDSLSADKTVKLEISPKATIYYVGLNQKVAALANPKVQEALHYLVDYKGIAGSILKGRYAVNQTFWPAGFWASLDGAPYALDVAKARKLLAEAGYPDGFAVQLDIGNTYPYAEIGQSLQATFGEAGIKVTINSADISQVLTKYRARNHQMVFMYWGPDYLDPNANAQTFAFNPNNADDSSLRTIAWRNAWDIPQFTQQTLDAARELDEGRRKELYLDLQRQLQASSPYLFLLQETETAALRASVASYFSGPTPDLVYYYAVKK